jgi:hypothetical protein
MATFTHPDIANGKVAVYVVGPASDMESWYDHITEVVDGEEEVTYYEVTGIVDSDTDVMVCMVGDDREHRVSRADLIPVDSDNVCSCGQLGCFSENALS